MANEYKVKNKAKKLVTFTGEEVIKRTITKQYDLNELEKRIVVLLEKKERTEEQLTRINDELTHLEEVKIEVEKVLV